MSKASGQVLSEALEEARRDERRRLSALIKENAKVFAERGSDKETAVQPPRVRGGVGMSERTELQRTAENLRTSSRLCSLCHHPKEHHRNGFCAECTSEQMFSKREAPCAQTSGGTYG